MALKEVVTLTVCERLENLMRNREWSIYRLGKESGLSQSTLAHVFRRDSEPTISTLETICTAFGITLAEFFSDGDFVPLTDEQRKLLDKWAHLNNEQRQLLLGMIENMK